MSFPDEAPFRHSDIDSLLREREHMLQTTPFRTQKNLGKAAETQVPSFKKSFDELSFEEEQSATEQLTSNHVNLIQSNEKHHNLKGL
jgi:hypothetical protein